MVKCCVLFEEQTELLNITKKRVSFKWLIMYFLIIAKLQSSFIASSINNTFWVSDLWKLRSISHNRMWTHRVSRVALNSPTPVQTQKCLKCWFLCITLIIRAINISQRELVICHSYCQPEVTDSYKTGFVYRNRTLTSLFQLLEVSRTKSHYL
jgi:hypothetical protein